MALSADQIATLEQWAFQIASGIVQAAPIIMSDIAAVRPYVDAIVEMAKTGGQPTDEAWAAVRAQLDAGSALLWSKAQAAQTQIDNATTGVPEVTA